MKIVLTRDLNPKKGMIRGAVFEWPRPVITEMSKQVGNDEWFNFSAEVEQSMNRQSLAIKERKRMDTVETVEKADASLADAKKSSGKEEELVEA